MLMNRDKSVLLIVDVQARLAPYIHDGQQVAEHCAWLAQVAERVCDRLSVIDNGRLLFVGTMDELKERYAEDASLESLFLRLVNESGQDGKPELFRPRCLRKLLRR